MDHFRFKSRRRFACAVGLCLILSATRVWGTAASATDGKSKHAAASSTAATSALPTSTGAFVFTRSTRIVVDSRYGSQLRTAAYWVQCYLCRVTGYTSTVIDGEPASGDLFLTIDTTKNSLGFTLKIVGDAGDKNADAADNGDAAKTAQLTPHDPQFGGKTPGPMFRPKAVTPPSGTKYVSLGAPDAWGVVKGALKLMGYLRDSKEITDKTFDSPPAHELSVTRIYQIAAGGPPVGTFDGDGYFTDTASTHANTGRVPIDEFDVSTAVDPAPPAVYGSERFGATTYVFPNLRPGVTYLVRLHFLDYYYTQPGQRVFNVGINGAPVLQNFDIIATAGGPLRAVVKEFSVQADDSGRIEIDLTPGPADLPKISAIEILYIG